MTNEQEPAIDTPAVPESTPTEAPDRDPSLDAIRELVLRAHPDAVPEMIAGESVEALLASIEPAAAAWQRLAQQRDRDATAQVPAGGARPLPIDPERLSASEKIRRGLARDGRQQDAVAHNMR